jgi:hypothetical protein
MPNQGRPHPSRARGQTFTPPAERRFDDKVIPQESEFIFEIIKIDSGGELTINAPGTVVHRFRVDPATVRFVDQP